MKKMKWMALVIAASMSVMMVGCSGTEESVAAQDQTASDDSSAVEEVVEEATEEEIAEELEQEEARPHLCLTGGEYLFKDYTYITNEYNDEDGSYYDEYVSEDGVQAVYEKGVKEYNFEAPMEDYMLEEAVKLAGDAEVTDATIEQASYETELSYPAYVAKFYSGSNEDTRSWIVYVVDTDCGLYMYGLSSAADYEDDMFYDADDVFPKLMIEENYRGLPVDEAGFEDGADLMDFLGSPIEEACAVVPALELNGEQYSSQEEVAAENAEHSDADRCGHAAPDIYCV